MYVHMHIYIYSYVYISLVYDTLCKSGYRYVCKEKYIFIYTYGQREMEKVCVHSFRVQKYMNVQTNNVVHVYV